MARRHLRTAYVGALLLGCALTGCAISGKCGIEGCPGDAEITAKVQAALDQRSDFGPPGTISVQTVNGVTYLSGAVPVNSMRREAADVARHVKGVTQVENTIAVPP
jgi:osmotically-inducible protein OsmY